MKNNWKEEFRKKFLPFYTDGGYEGMPTLVEEEVETLEDYISALLASQLKEVLGVIESKRPEHKDMTYVSEEVSKEEFAEYYNQVKGWNQCIKHTNQIFDDLKAAVSQLAELKPTEGEEG